MEFRTLSYFLGVLENRSFTAAAKALYITQPALTKAIKRLEDELGVKLFDRSSGGTTPTKYGELLAHHARRITEEQRHAKLEISNLKNGFKGSVRVGAGPVWSSHMLPQAVNRLRDEGQNIKITLITDAAAPLKKRLLDGGLDLICGDIDYPIHPDIHKEHIHSADVILCGRDGHPLAGKSLVEYADLTKFSWVVLANMPDKLQPHFTSLDIAIEVASVEDLLMAAKTDDYLVPLPLSLIPKAESVGIVRLPFKGPLYSFPIGIAYLRDARTSPSVASVLSIIRSFTWE